MHIWTPTVAESGESGPQDPHGIAATNAVVVHTACSIRSAENLDLSSEPQPRRCLPLAKGHRRWFSYSGMQFIS